MLTDPNPASDTHSRDHWWTRPGWGPHTQWYTVHATFGAQPGTAVLHTHAERWRPLLDRPGWDLIPLRWLHLTMQGVGDVELVPRGQVERLTAALRRAVGGTGTARVELGPVAVDAEGINLPAHGEGAAALDRVRDGVRTAIGQVLGEEAVEEGPRWRPHVSLAYAHTTGAPLGPVREELAARTEPVQVGIDHLDLIALRRQGHLYRWEEIARLPLC